MPCGSRAGGPRRSTGSVWLLEHCRAEDVVLNHHNTKNPHAHIVVRGVDRDGEDLRIDKSYIGYACAGARRKFSRASSARD
jgi:hypothetical protein